MTVLDLLWCSLACTCVVWSLPSRALGLVNNIAQSCWGQVHISLPGGLCSCQRHNAEVDMPQQFSQTVMHTGHPKAGSVCSHPE